MLSNVVGSLFSNPSWNRGNDPAPASNIVVIREETSCKSKPSSSLSDIKREISR